MDTSSPDHAAQRAEGVKRRIRANKALIRYRQRAAAQRERHVGANLSVWARLLSWQLAWEHAILCYRDDNNFYNERTDDDAANDTGTCNGTGTR